ncbi:MAG: hypothetical protein J5796_00290 [Erysipelotrichaceae bacterium]|nr:hypothetical protein [Erysipelotrichaceae bacterium]
MKKILLSLLSITICISLSACSQSQTADNDVTVEDQTVERNVPQKEDITINETYVSSEDGEHAIEVSGETASYSNIKVEKTGESSGDEADFYGENAAVFATDGAALTLSNIVVETDGTHANGVFSYGSGTTVNISDSVIETTGNCSGGLMTTGGGTMNAANLNIHTTGNSSAAIRSDRGGGTVNVTEGSYVTDGKGSPAIYSTANITVSDAYLEATSSQGVVVEGKNSVTLNDVELVANNISKNSDKSDWYQAVMIYQSMSGDADEGLASFTMKDGSLLNKNGDVFFVNNTMATISLENVSIVNEDTEGYFLRAAAAGWGNEGSNGGHVTMDLNNQTVEGDIIVDEVSTLNMYLKDGSSYAGVINQDGEAGEVYVEIEEGSKWTLTADSYVTSLTCAADCIDLNGHKLYVNGEEYQEGTASSGEAIEVEITSSGNGMQMPGGTPPEGGMPPGEMPGGTPPEGGMPPGGMPGDGQEPPEKPEGEAPERP